MKYYVPDYYAQFRCIADRCKHSCCIGWEIDIDPGTLETYRTLPGDVGEALRRSIVETEEGAHFRLTEDERCPMLMENGLCRLICAHGEESLCQICADHPRFRNFFPNRTEMGLGLCCEAAAELILLQTEKVQLICPDQADETAPDDETAAFLAFRDQLIATAQMRSLPLKERMEQLLQAVSLSMPGCDFLPLYRSLEQLDPAWDKLLSSLPSLAFASLPACPAPLETAMEQFLVYLLFRHGAAAFEDEDIAGHTAFCVLSACVLLSLCQAKPGCTMEDFLNFARMYSSEIEYSQENMDALLDALWEEV